MFSKKSEESHSHWISFTDLVTGFMFVFIVVSLIALGQINPPPPPDIAPPEPETEREPDTVRGTPEGKYKEIVGIFQQHLEGFDAIEIADSATIRFSVKPDSPSPLFRPNKSEPTTYFRSILERFVPIYLKEVHQLFAQQDSSGFSIREIRIEGHTDPANEYLYNLGLSSNRALEVQKYILGHREMGKYSAEFQKFMEAYSIACGYSFSRTLDRNGKRVDHQKAEEVDFNQSRRVELRIILEHKNE